MQNSHRESIAGCWRDTEMRRAGLSRFRTEAASSTAGPGWNKVFLSSCGLAATPALPACISHLPQPAETVPGIPALGSAYKWPRVITGCLGYTLLWPFWNGDERPSCGCPGQKLSTLRSLHTWNLGRGKPSSLGAAPRAAGPCLLWPVEISQTPSDSGTSLRGERIWLGSWRDGPDGAAK